MLSYWLYFLRCVNHQTTTFWPDLIVIELLHGCFGLLFCAEGHEGVATVVTIEVHHHPHLIDLTKLETDREIFKKKKNRFPVLGKCCVPHFPPSHIAAPVHPQTDPLVVSLQRSRCLSLVVVRSSQAVAHHTDVGRFPETHKKNVNQKKVLRRFVSMSLCTSATQS